MRQRTETLLTTQPDNVVTTRNTPLIINVLKNDGGTGVIIVATSSPGYGTLSVNNNQTITYTPPANFTGLDSFSYTVRDAANDTKAAIVTVRVIENAPPVAVDDAVTVITGKEIEIPVLANDNDPDLGDRITLVASTAPAFGSISLGSDARTFRYIATSGYVGIDSFVYTIRDSFGQSATGKVIITVKAPNTAPVLTRRRFETLEDTTLEIDLLVGATDPDGDAVYLHRIGYPGHGSISITNGHRGFYTPVKGFVGVDSFTFTVRDARGATTKGVIEIHVKERNKRPVAANDNVETSANSPITIDVLGNDTDPDGDPLTISDIVLPVHGTVTLNADNTITYTPTQGYVGADQFAYSATDGKGGEDEGLVSINVVLPDIVSFANGYANRRRCAVAGERVAGIEALKDFPLFTYEQSDWLKSVSHGGKVEHEQGFDIRFELVDGTQLDHDLESYDPSTGTLSAWVRLPNLKAVNHTEFYLYYGKPNLSTSEEWAVGVWQNYLAVIDCDTGADRSGNGRDATPYNVEPATLLGEAGQYNGSDSRLEAASPHWLDDLDALTAQVVFKSDSIGADQALFWVGKSNRESEAGLGIYYDSQPDNTIWGRLGAAAGSSSAKSVPGTHTTEPYWAALTWSHGKSVTLYGQGVPLTLSNTPAQLAGPTGISDFAGADDAPLVIGTGNANWRGLIDEVRFCASELSPAWLATEYRNQHDPSTFYGIGDEEQVDDAPAPVALPETFRVLNSESMDLDVLANDLGNQLTITTVSAPAYGTVTDVGNGAGPLRYTPASDFVGIDRLTYTIADNDGRTTEGIVRLDVEAPVVPPPPPPPPPLLAPTGNVGTLPITFSWRPTEGATQYLLRVRDAANDAPAYATKRTAIGFGCESGTCSFELNELGAGSYNWEVRPFVGDDPLDFIPPLAFVLDQGDPPPPPPPPPPADDELPAVARTVDVSTYAQLSAAIANASPGDHITLANGIYDGATIDVSAQGTAANPIVVRAKNIGGAVFAKKLNFTASSKYVYCYGLRFDDGGPGGGAVVYVRGNNHTIKRCYFNVKFNSGNGRGIIRMRDCNNLNISYCDFTQKTQSFDSGFLEKACNYIQNDSREANGSDGSYNVTIERCHFHDMPPQLDYRTPYLKVLSNAIGPNQAYIKTNWRLRYNLFERINSGFVIWEFKGGYGTAEFNTMLNSNGYVSFRQGPENVSRGNWMENCQSWRVHDRDCILHDNIFTKAKILIMAGLISHETKNDERWQNAFNTLLVRNDSPITAGEKFGGEKFAARDTYIEGNIGTVTYGLQSNTDVRAQITSSLPRVTPIKLGATDVGPLANLS